MDFRHSHDIGHFDLTGTNVMVDQSRTLKVIDFGMAEIVSGHLTVLKESTAHYLAPEIMRINRRMDSAWLRPCRRSLEFWCLLVLLVYRQDAIFRRRRPAFWYLQCGTIWFCRPSHLPGLWGRWFQSPYPIIAVSQPTDRATFQSLPGGSFLHWQALWNYTVTARLSKTREWLSSAQLKCAFCPACEGSTISWMCCQCFLRLIFLFRNSGRQWFYSDWFFWVYQHIWISKSPTAIGFLGFINTSGSARGLVDPSESKNSNEDKASEEREVSPVRFLLYHTYILHTHIYIYIYMYIH